MQHTGMVRGTGRKPVMAALSQGHCDSGHALGAYVEVESVLALPNRLQQK